MLLSQRKVIDVSESKGFCSADCYSASNYFLAQLSEEPVYLRLPAASLPRLSDRRHSSVDMRERDRSNINMKSLMDALPTNASIDSLSIKEKDPSLASNDRVAAPEMQCSATAVEGYQPRVGPRRASEGLSLFGKLWTFLSESVSKETKQLRLDYAPTTNESGAMEVQMTDLSFSTQGCSDLTPEDGNSLGDDGEEDDDEPGGDDNMGASAMMFRRNLVSEKVLRAFVFGSFALSPRLLTATSI